MKIFLFHKNIFHHQFVLNLLQKKPWNISWQNGITKKGILKNTILNKTGPLVLKGKIPNPLFPLSANRLIIKQRTPGLVVELIDSALETALLSWVDYDMRARPGDLRINMLINQEFELLDHRPEERSTLYKHFKNQRLFQFLALSEEIINGATFQAEWVFSEVTHPQWAYSYLYQREEKKRGKEHIAPSEYLQMLQDDPNGKKCQQIECDNKSIKHSSLCKIHHYEAVMGQLPV